LFETFVDVPEATLAQELYMSLDQLRCLQRHGMYIGSHGYRHEWLTDSVQKCNVGKTGISSVPDKR
jgi:hypothetical protein